MAWAPWAILAASAVVAPVLLFITAPYGRYFRPGFGPSVPARLGWVVMESPSLLLFGFGLSQNPFVSEPSVGLMGALWLVHYFQRTAIFPLLMRGEGKRQPWLTFLLAIAFNTVNAWSNAGALAPRPFDARFGAGTALFVVGFAINLHSDAVLRALRPEGQSGYFIPRAGLFRWVSAANYFGELLEWVGFAIAAWTLPALAFAVFTAANLGPRAWAHHKWYQRTFADYPTTRRALIPFVL